MGDWIKLAAQWALGRPSLYTIPSAIPWLHLGETRYHPPHPPDRMSRLAQAALWATWEPSARESGCRRALAERWKQVLEGQNDIQPIVVRAGSEPGWLRFPVVVAPGLVSPFCSPSARRLGIMPGYPGPLDRLLPLKPSLLDSEGSRWTGAETLVERLFTLPTHSRLSSEAQHRIGQFLQSVRLS
jgi:dTDP-4-amino-4,6-dideoxygalactose transaminase